MSTYDDSNDDLSKPNLLRYGIVPSAPAIQVPDVALFKNNKTINARHHFESKLEEIKRLYENFLTQLHVNDAIYSAKYNFVPIVGKTYYLYQSQDGFILSLIEPQRWVKHEFLGAYRLTSSDIWELVEN